MSVHLPFNERKATEAAARLLKLRGGTMSYMKLIKLLYLADREALLRWGRPISTDRYVSMDRGPVLSHVLNLVTDEADRTLNPCGLRSFQNQNSTKFTSTKKSSPKSFPMPKLSYSMRSLVVTGK